MSRDLFLGFVVVAAIAAPMIHPLQAQPAAVPARKFEIERIDLPATRQEEWPAGVDALTPVSREEFARLWRLSLPAESAPHEISIPSATFRGVLQGRDLVGSEFSLTVHRSSGASEWFAFTPWTPALSQVRWTDSPALWGRAPDGRTWLRIDRPRAELTGRWSLRGDMRGEEVHFHWQTLRAAVTRLELRTPLNFVVTTDSGDARRVPSQAGDGSALWELHLGPKAEAHVSIGPARAPQTMRPRILMDQEINSQINEGDLNFKAVCQLEVHDSPVQLLNFDLPTGVEVFSASIGGEAPLDWSITTTEGRRQLAVRLPDPVQGRVRVVLDGIAILKPGQAVGAPQISLRDAIFLANRQTFTVSPPLKIHAIRGTAYRQQSPITPTAAGDFLSFQLLAPEGQVLLELRRPQATLSTQVLGQLQLGGDDWSSITDVVWSATSGAVFQTACRIPAQWEVSEVQPAPWVTDSQLASWDVQPGAGGTSTLTLEFYEAITPGTPRGVRIYLRRAAPALPVTAPPPLPLATDAELDSFGLEVVVPSSLSVLPADNSNLNLLPAAAAPESWRGTAAALALDIAGSRTARRFRCEPGDVPGELKIEANPGPGGLGGEVSVEADSAAVRCSLTMRLQRGMAGNVGVRWYVSGPSTDVVWMANGTAIPESALRRLPAERHRDWKLPESGTLWEWVAPTATEGEIVITGAATLRWSERVEIPLVFLPDLAGGLYRVSLARTEPDVVSYDDRGLSLESFVDSPMVGKRLDDGGRDRRVWRYDAAEDQLLLSRRETTATVPEPTSASLLLESLLSTGIGGIDLHRATLTLSGPGKGDALSVTLPTGSRLLELWRDGERQAVLPLDLNLRVPLGGNRARHTIEIFYEEPASPGFLRERRTVIPPQPDCPVSQFRWHFSVPAGTVLASAPTGVVLETPLPPTGWARRMLGPLGRAAGEPLFNPLSGTAWRQLWSDGAPPPSPRRPADLGFSIPEEWTTRVAASAVAPPVIVLDTWNGMRLQLIEWAILLGVTLVGLLVRLRRIQRRDRIAAIWLSLSGAAALCGPPPLAPLAGSVCAGMLLAMLAPRSLLSALRWEMAGPSATSTVPGGSTQSFRYTPPAVALLITLYLSSAAAQPPGAAASLAGTPERWRVYVLVDDDRQPSRTLPLVYLDAELLQQLRRSARAPGEPSWLLTTADYDVTVAADRSAEVKAVFQATVLHAGENSVLELPVAGGSLKNRDGCRVNGRTVVAVRAADESGWLIPLPADVVANEPQSVRIELDLLTPPSAQGGAAAALKIPPVAASTAAVRWSNGSEWTVAGGHGSRSILSDGSALLAQLGAIDELRVVPAASPTEPVDVQLDVRMVQTVDCRAAWSEVRFRCRCAALQGNLRSLRLQTPPTAVVREVRGDGLSGYRVIRDKGSQEVLLTFQPEERSQWLLEGTLLVPQNPNEPDRPIPVVQPIATEHVQVARITTTCGLGSTPDHRIELREVDDPALTPITRDAFLQTWGETGLTVSPQLTFDVRPGSGNPSFRLTNSTVQRRALRWNQTGTFRPRRMEWLVQGELETTGGAWSHSLIVDRRLRIESISVEENGAQRLLYRTESRLSNSQQNRVVLFLSERTTGLQNITIRATGPTRPGSPQPLPGIYCEGAVLIDGRIALYSDQDLMLEMPSVRGLERLEGGAETTADAEAPTLFGRFQVLEPEVNATLRVISRLGRCSARNALVIAPTEQNRWRVRGRLEMTPADPATREMACDMPVEWGSSVEFTVEGARTEVQSLPTGGTRLVLQRIGSMTDPVRVNYGVELSSSSGREWAIPLPQPQQCPQIETVVGIPQSDVWEAAPEQAVIPADSRPEWLFELWEGWSQESAMTLIRPRRDALTLVRRAPPQLRTPREIPFMEHRIRLTNHDEVAGTTLLLVRPGSGTLDLSVPAEIQLRSALEGERPLATTSAGQGRVRFTLEGGSGTTLVVLNWTRHWSESWSPVEQHAETLPVVVGLVPQRHWVGLESGQDDWLIPQSGLDRRTGLDQALARLETLLQIRPQDPPPAWQNPLFQWSYAQIAAAMPAAVEAGGGQRPGQLEQWNHIVETINERRIRIEAPAAGSGPIWQTAGSVPRGVSGEVRSTTGDFRLWQVRRQELLLWLALPVTALLISALLRWLRLPYADWLHSRPALAWMLLGMLWWMWLSPSLLGLPLIGVGIWRAIRQPPAEVPGTLVG